jgi:rhamnosyl/mannosyltransferase
VVADLSLRGLVEGQPVSPVEKRKISVLCYGRFFDEIPGGIQTHTLHLMRALADEVNFVHVVTSRDSTGAVVRAGPRIPVMRTASWNVDGSLALSPAMISQSRRLHRKHRFDLVHLHFPDPMAHLASMALPAHIPRVISWHADILRHRALRLLYGPVMKRAVQSAAAIIVATPAHATSSIVLAPLRHDPKVHVIPYGFDLSRFLAPAAGAAEISRRYPGRLIFAAGRHVSYKGFHVLIEAMAGLPPDVQLLLGGDGPLTPGLKQLARDLNISERVHFLGFVPDADLPAHYQAAELFCLPSVTQAEAFGIVQVEAMACGKPVVSTRLNNGVDFVNEDERTGLTVTPGDSAALRDAILRLLGDPALAARLGGHGRNKALDQYSLGSLRTKILGVYRSVLPVGRP